MSGECQQRERQRSTDRHSVRQQVSMLCTAVAHSTELCFWSPLSDQVPGWPHVAVSMASNAVVAVHMSHDRSDRSDGGTSGSHEQNYVQRKIVMYTSSGLSNPRVDWIGMISQEDRVQYNLALQQLDASSDRPKDEGCDKCKCHSYRNV